MRNPEWYLKAYRFLAGFKGYVLQWDSFLDGMFEHHCLSFDGEWLGPEVIVNMSSGRHYVATQRLLKARKGK